MLVANGRAEAEGLGLLGSQTALVGTVPVQHSYGFESTFLLALHGGCAFWSGRPFYPQDVADALCKRCRARAWWSPRLFTCPPCWPRTCTWPVVHAWLSATAPLESPWRRRSKQRSAAPVFEIYGSTESSQLAWRRTTQGRCLAALARCAVDAKRVTRPRRRRPRGRVCAVVRPDRSARPDGRSLLHGRHADLINIAGKRTSLAYLNHQLAAIDGVEDGAFYMPDEPSGDAAGLQVVRLAAFVVAPQLARPALMAALRASGRSDFSAATPGLGRGSAAQPHGQAAARSALQSLYDQSKRGST